MTSITPRTALIALLAGLALAPAAHGQATNPTSGEGGQSCNDNGKIIEDGYRGTFVTRYSRGTVTCTDGTICVTISTPQSDGSVYWSSDCYDSPAVKHAVPVKSLGKAKPVQTHSSR